MSRKWSLTERFTIDDENGAPQFEVQGRFSLGANLTMRDPMGMDVATITRPALSRQYQIVAEGQPATVRPAGFLGRRFEIDTSTGHLQATGNFSGRQYTVARGGTPTARVSQQFGLRERFAVEVEDGESPVLMLAVILVIETIRDQQRAAASG